MRIRDVSHTCTAMARARPQTGSEVDSYAIVRLQLHVHGSAVQAPVIEPVGHIPTDAHATVGDVVHVGDGGVAGEARLGDTVNGATILGEVVDVTHTLDAPVTDRAVGQGHVATHVLCGVLEPDLEVAGRRAQVTLAYTGGAVVVLAHGSVEVLIS